MGRAGRELGEVVALRAAGRRRELRSHAAVGESTKRQGQNNERQRARGFHEIALSRPVASPWFVLAAGL